MLNTRGSESLWRSLANKCTVQHRRLVTCCCGVAAESQCCREQCCVWCHFFCSFCSVCFLVHSVVVCVSNSSQPGQPLGQSTCTPDRSFDLQFFKLQKLLPTRRHSCTSIRTYLFRHRQPTSSVHLHARWLGPFGSLGYSKTFRRIVLESFFGEIMYFQFLFFKCPCFLHFSFIFLFFHVFSF